MRIQFGDPPEICVGEGSEAIGLMLRAWSGRERLAVADAVAAGNLEMLQRAVEPLVVGWRNVCDASGAPLAFAESGDATRKVSPFDRLMGGVSFDAQQEILTKVLGLLGLQQGGAAAPTSPPAGAGNTNAAGG